MSGSQGSGQSMYQVYTPSPRLQLIMSGYTVVDLDVGTLLHWPPPPAGIPHTSSSITPQEPSISPTSHRSGTCVPRPASSCRPATGGISESPAFPATSAPAVAASCPVESTGVPAHAAADGAQHAGVQERQYIDLGQEDDHPGANHHHSGANHSDESSDEITTSRSNRLLAAAFARHPAVGSSRDHTPSTTGASDNEGVSESDATSGQPLVNGTEDVDERLSTEENGTSAEVSTSAGATCQSRRANAH